MLNSLFRKCVIFHLLSLSLWCVTAQGVDSLEAKISTLLEITGSKQNATVALDEIMKQYESMGMLDDHFLAELDSTIRSDGFERVKSLIISSYKRHFTEGQIDSLIIFYRSDLGQKVVKESPAIIQESMQAGGAYGEKIAEDIMKKQQAKLEKLFNSPCTLPKALKKGKFTYDLKDGSTVIVKRKNGKQYEIYDNTVKTYEIEWESNCKYILHPIDQSKNRIEDQVLIVNVYKLSGNVLQYVAQYREVGLCIKGTMRKID